MTGDRAPDAGALSIEPLVTERLVLRPLAAEDAPELFSIYSNADAMRYWHTPPHASVEATRAALVASLQGGRHWTIRLSEGASGALGVVGYLEQAVVPGLGYILHPDAWGHGYATEAVQAALEYGFTRMDLDRVELWIHEGNLRSQRTAQRLGFTFRGRFLSRDAHRPAPHETRVYGMHVDEWRAIRAGESAAGAPAPPCYRVEPILAAPDVGAAAAWYRDKLEFTINWLWGDPPAHGSVSLGQWTTEGASIQLSQAAGPIAQPREPALYLFVGADIDARYARYRERGVEMARPLANLPWGMREFTARDLNGYLLRFGTPS